MPIQESDMSNVDAKPVKRGRPQSEKQWNFYTTGGEPLGKLWFKKDEIKENFPKAKVKGTNVYL